jgi:hypothetical protein
MKQLYTKRHINNKLAKQQALKDIFTNYNYDIRYNDKIIDVYNVGIKHLICSPTKFYNQYINLKDK